MGMLVSVYRAAGRGDCTNSGASSSADFLCVVNVEGPYEPSAEMPGVELIRRGPRLILIPACEPGMAGRVGPMFGGNYAASSDSRFRDAVGDWCGAVPIFDRYEGAEEYAANFD